MTNARDKRDKLLPWKASKMLGRMKQAIEASTASAEIEIPKTKKIESRVCEKCGSENLWQPRKSDSWECFRCNPPRTESMVAQTRLGLGLVSRASDGSRELQSLGSVLTRSWGPFIVAHSGPVCECGCDWTEERGTLFEVFRVCVLCKKEVSIPDFPPIASR